MANVTQGISFPPDELQRLQDAAEKAGMSLSAYMVRAGRQQWLRDQGVRYRQIMESLPPEDRLQLEQLREASMRAMREAGARLER